MKESSDSSLIRRALVLVLFGLAEVAGVQFAQPRVSLAEDQPQVAFQFHNEFWMNLHYFLYAVAEDRYGDKFYGYRPTGERGLSTLKGLESCSLGPHERDAIEDSISFYRRQFFPGLEPSDLVDLREIRLSLRGLDQDDTLQDTESAAAYALSDAASIYSDCLWNKHRSANAQWIAAMRPHVESVGTAAISRVLDVYRLRTRMKIRVDVTTFGRGGDIRPPAPHLVFGHQRPENGGLDGLERLISRAGWVVLTPGWFSNLGVQKVRKSMSFRSYRMFHVELYQYTVGVIVVNEMARAGLNHQSVEVAHNDEEFWEKMVPLFRRHWRPFLEGQVEREDALRPLVAATVTDLVE